MVEGMDAVLDRTDEVDVAVGRPAGASPAPDMATISKGGPEEPGKAVEKLRGLLGKAHKGEEDAVPEIRQILSDHPDLARQFADVARIAEDALIKGMTKEGDLAAKELIRCQLEVMRKEIAAKPLSSGAAAFRACSRHMARGSILRGTLRPEHA